MMSEYYFNLFVKLNIDIYNINPLHYISLPGVSFDCFLKVSEVELETIQDKQKLKDFISAKRSGICGVMGNRYIKSQNQRRNQSQSQSESQSQSHSQNQNHSQNLCTNAKAAI